MNALEAIDCSCPNCGTTIVLTVDTSAGTSDYIEDCPVCCRPIRIRLSIGAAGPQLELKSENA